MRRIYGPETFRTKEKRRSVTSQKLQPHTATPAEASNHTPDILVGFELNLIFLEIFRKKISNIKFHQNPYNGRRAVPRGRMDGRT